MKLHKILPVVLAAMLLPLRAANDPDAGQICISVGRLLEQGHYTRKKLSEPGFSEKFLKNYLDFIDFNHLFFTQKDIARFENKYAASLADDILLGNPAAAFEIWDTYVKRVESRIASVKELIKQEYKFDSERKVELNRSKLPWPKDEAEANQLWRDRIEGELLDQKLVEKPIEPGVKIVTRRYDQVLRNVHEQNTREDVLKTFLTVLAQSYDPHSEYLSKSDLENFSINMRLSLVGIGAVLQSDEGYAKIMDLVPGGPAQLDGRLKVGDRISAVAQGDKEFVDVVGMKLDKVVEMIRGSKGTKVRLQYAPAHASDPAERKEVTLTRNEIKLKEQEAKAEIIERPGAGGRPERIGWITLPSFYADMEHMGAKGAKSTTRDVATLLERLKKENIGGLVLDLRRNGGGSLEEAVHLTGLFIKKGPVVQAKDANGNIHASSDTDPSIAWDGPLIVLTNRLSASASEITAAALQDYERAVIVGDTTTFGKGTVQTMLEIGRFIPFLGSESNQAGALKLTIQKFYRIAGGSTQFKGVLSDIKLPSPFDHPDIGESALKNPLPYDEVDPVKFEKWDRPLPIKELRLRSAARVASDLEFAFVKEDLERLEKRIAENTISLNEKKRREEIAQDKARKDKREAARKKLKKPEEKDYIITLDNVTKPELELVKNEPKKKIGENTPPSVQSETAEDGSEEGSEKNAEKAPAIDPVRNETLNIMRDFIELARLPKTAQAKQ